MTKAFFISKSELFIIVEALHEKLGEINADPDDYPAEKLEEIDELFCDLNAELKDYDKRYKL